MERRTLVRVLGTAAVGGVAGCATENSGDTAVSDTDSEAGGDAPGDGLVTVSVEGGVDETVERIRDDIEASPLSVLATVDHAANAASVDRDLPPTTLLLFGNPDVGTPLMREARSVGIDLPQKLLVWVDDGQVKVSYNDPRYLARRHGIEGQDDRLEQINTVLERLATGSG